MVDSFCGAFNARSVIISVDSYEALRELAEQFYLMLVLVNLSVERLK